jgi:RNA polymerase sigma-70 factor (ECF subfamily)
MSSTIEHHNQRGGSQPDAPLSQWTDEQLLLHYREQGTRAAFEELVGRYQDELYAYLCRYLGNAQMAEDAFQTTFLQVHLKCDQFQADRRVRPWLYTIATNQAIDTSRRSRRHRMASLDRRSGPDRQDESDVAAMVDLFDSGVDGPFEELQLEERRQIVSRRVEELPDTWRQVVLMVYYQGLKHREAAEALSIPVGTVKSRLHAAMKKLEESLTPAQLVGP